MNLNLSLSPMHFKRRLNNRFVLLLESVSKWGSENSSVTIHHKKYKKTENESQTERPNGKHINMLYS